MYFLDEKIKRILTELKEYITHDSREITSYKMKPGDFKGGEKIDLDTSSWLDFNNCDSWGGRDKHCWFRTEVEIPSEYQGKTVGFEIKTGREGQWDADNPQFLIYVNEKVIQGLDVNHRDIIISEEANTGDRYTIALYSYSGMKEANSIIDCKIYILDKKIEKLYYNIKVPLDVAVLLDKEDKKRIDIINFLNEAVNKLDLRKPFSDSFYQTLYAADDFLEQKFYNEYCGCDDITAVCVGHTHIDVAWLWTLSQTREKTTRSFSTVLNLMKQYPEYIFMSSQPQLYKFIKEDHPDIYEEIKARVKEGRWEPEGAMWLEADCNLSSGESLVRQVLFGTRFFESEFGVKSKILWLPDVFGYSAALPQILKKSGIDYFMTTKISWNEYNKMPYDTFYWRGMDGTEILTHFITTSDFKGDSWLNEHATTYNGALIPNQVMGSWKRYQHKDLNNEVLISFGYGDGGGGPTKEMLENAKRMEKGIPGCPKVKIGNSLDFFKALENKVQNQKKLPKWVGELYLEYHRGTYTSMARNKKYNRKNEFLYQDAELLSTLNNIQSIGQYPQEKINRGWETILLNQFHDILPGSSIKEVYEDSKNQYIEVEARGKELLNEAIKGIAEKINLQDSSVIVFNQLGFNRSDIVEIDLPEKLDGVIIKDQNGIILTSQIIITKDGHKKLIFFAKNIPSKGYKVFKLEKKEGLLVNDTGNIKADKNGLSNKYFEISFDADKNITSIFDKLNKRELLKAGTKANVLQAFEDKPHNFDAWDINIYYQDKMWEVNDIESVKIIDEGPVKASIRIRRKFLDSIIEQDVCIYNELPRIDFITNIDWKEKQILLKTAFPMDIRSDKATYDIQYGNVERPTHWNTSWDFARFEVCAHKWADLSENNYGVSILNDCKYGHDIKDGVMRLTLLKSATSPNVDADREIHEFTYSIYPHSSDWRAAGTVNMAYMLNCPLYAKIEESHDGILPLEYSFVKCDQENVVIEVVKKAEDSDNIIIRLYECFNNRATVNLTFAKKIQEAWECDLMERNLSNLATGETCFQFEIKPYEIKTFMIRI